MGQLPDFQVYQHIAAQQAIEKDQIDIKVISAERKTFLPGFKKKPLAEFQQEGFKPINNGAF